MGILRVLLALVVIFGHAGESSFRLLGNDGGIAVIAFFVISGFYMALITNKYQLSTLNFRHIKNFYFSRILRIYPVFWVCSIATLVAAYFGICHPDHSPYETLKSLHHLQDKLFYIFENIFICGQDTARFLTYDNNYHGFIFDPMQTKVTNKLYPGSSYALLGQSWSLAIELTFYILVPFILTKNNKFIAAICLLAFAIRHFINNHPAWQTYSVEHAFFPSILGMFLLGSLSYRIIYQRLNVDSGWIKYAAWSAIFIIALYSVLSPAKDELFIAIVTLSIPFLFGYFKNSKLDNWIGELSFPIYMTQFIFMSFAHKYSYPGLIAGSCSIAAAIFLVYTVIKPIDYYRHQHFLRRQQRQEKRDQSIAMEHGLVTR